MNKISRDETGQKSAASGVKQDMTADPEAINKDGKGAL